MAEAERFFESILNQAYEALHTKDKMDADRVRDYIEGIREDLAELEKITEGMDA